MTFSDEKFNKQIAVKKQNLPEKNPDEIIHNNRPQGIHKISNKHKNLYKKMRQKSFFIIFSRTFCSNNDLKYISHFIPSSSNSTSHTLHLLQIYSIKNKSLKDTNLPEVSNLSDESIKDLPSCFLLHGGIENGKIFYTLSGKGLGPFLAKLGYNVFICDLRGKGLSKPLVKDDINLNYGVKEITNETIPTFISYIKKLTNNSKLCWISHSIGGVLMSSTLARHPSLINDISCQIHFATKRTIQKNSGINWFILNIFYGLFCHLLVSIYGYVPAKKFKLGSDDDTALAFQTGYHWIHPKTNQWIDTEDNFHYFQEYSKNFLQKKVIIPPSLVFTSKDDILARPEDVKSWCEEVGIPLSSVVELSGNQEASKDKIKYNHFNMLTSPQAENDHFQLVKIFLEKYHQFQTSSGSSQNNNNDNNNN